ncbi:carbohydrate ABC transporter permease [Sphaerochaeta sp.]|uniref:carbohydrate ABC transporter permease n=1 Tax=Sphaerochaeta sp. TaxID=1972642 RepID=UPI002FC78442
MSSKNSVNGKTPYGWIYLFLLPTLVLYGVYSLWPVLATLYYSFLDWNGFQVSGVWNGLGNYAELLSDSLFWNSLKATVWFILIVVPLRFFISLFFGILLNWSRLRYRSVFRTLLFIPVVTTSAIVGTIMNMIFDPMKGPFNLLLSQFGLIQGQTHFLGSAETALVTAGCIWVWKWLGTSIIYWIASLQSIPNKLYEAARIDGAGAWTIFKSITAPLLVPFGIIIFVLTLSDAMRVFDLMLTLTGGGPFFRTEVIELFIYRWAFGASVPRLGYASAAATIFGLVFMILTIAQLTIGRRSQLGRGEE